MAGTPRQAAAGPECLEAQKGRASHQMEERYAPLDQGTQQEPVLGRLPPPAAGCGLMINLLMMSPLR